MNILKNIFYHISGPS